jgi:hypothetical protein
MRFILGLSLLALGMVSSGAAPVPTDAKVLVAALSDPSQKARDDAQVALRTRPDAAPWLRRAARSPDRDTAQRSAALLTAFAKQRQAAAPAAIKACIKSGRADLFVEWHHFWQPEAKDDLWPLGPEAGKAGVDAFAARHPPGVPTQLEKGLGSTYSRLHKTPLAERRILDGPFGGSFPLIGRDSPWLIRTDRLLGHTDDYIAFASVAGRIKKSDLRSGYYFTLGEVDAYSGIALCVVVCDGPLTGTDPRTGEWTGGHQRIVCSFVVCRGDVEMPTGDVIDSVVLVDGNIDLSRSADLRDSVIRATGEIRLPKVVRAKNDRPPNCKIEAHAKDATAPYKFFELSDVGLSVVDDEEGMVVADVKPGTPFGNSGLKKGDVIQAIDDQPPGHSSEFRRKVRRAMVRQGDCLVTAARGREKIDLPVYFPPPK